MDQELVVLDLEVLDQEVCTDQEELADFTDRAQVDLSDPEVRNLLQFLITQT